MNSEKSLQEVLAKLIEQSMPSQLKRPLRGGLQMRPQVTPKDAASKIAKDLVQQAVASGLPLRNIRVVQRPLSGGNTAESVAELTLHAPFVFKLDSKESKLAAEGRIMRDARNDSRLTEKARSAWPVVYAIREEAPYAYLMEYFPRDEGWISLEDRLYPVAGSQSTSDSDAIRFVHAVLDVLVETYASSANMRTVPSIDQDYVGRIINRLQAVADDKRFASQPLRINGEHFEPWQHYLDRLKANKGFIAAIAPPFTTIVHGDPNPGNLMLRTDLHSIEVKLIDPKEWQIGDYLFDIAKITHFVEGTGPIEKPAHGEPTQVEYVETGGKAELRYRIDQPAWTRGVVDACLDRVRQVAQSKGDEQWLARYELAMAANLLGLPEGRLKKQRPHAALALYGEGLRWLKRFCERLPDASPDVGRRLIAASLTEVEPEPLAQARQRVRDEAPGVVDGVDRRGFRTLHWAPKRANKAGKPVELSLEHEARLMPTSARALDELKESLAASAQMPAGNVLLPGHGTFGGWSVRRLEREPGAQSVDRYWDLGTADAKPRLIPRLLTLRERVKTSAFMTWDSAGEERSLNLELPFVAYSQGGVIARLEFNWIDKMDLMLGEFNAPPVEGSIEHPLVLAARIAGIDKGEFQPILEHTTFREKYSVLHGDEEIFHLNVDHVVAQSLRTKRIASFTDIDIAPARLVDPDVLGSLVTFAEAVALRFGLVTIGATKAYCGARATGEL